MCCRQLFCSISDCCKCCTNSMRSGTTPVNSSYSYEKVSLGDSSDGEVLSYAYTCKRLQLVLVTEQSMKVSQQYDIITVGRPRWLGIGSAQQRISADITPFCFIFTEKYTSRRMKPTSPLFAKCVNCLRSFVVTHEDYKRINVSIYEEIDAELS